MKKLTYDIEIFPNYFLIVFKDYQSKEFFCFEISERKNKKTELLNFLKQDLLLVGFNSIHFDNLILNYIKDIEGDWLTITKKVWEKGQHIIQDTGKENEIAEKEDIELQYEFFTKEPPAFEWLNLNQFRGDNFEKYKKLRWNQSWQTIDLFCYWSKLIRQSRKISLKSLACNLNWSWIQELPYPPNHWLNVDQIDEVIEYCKNDVNITERLIEALKDSINLRHSIQQEQGLKCLSWDGIKIGTEILAKELSEQTGVEIEEIKGHKTIHKKLRPANFLPTFRFDSPEVNKLYDFITSIEIKANESIPYTLYFKNPNGTYLKSDLGIGGIHGVTSQKIIIPADDEICRDDDVESLYPTLGIEWEFIPKHLPSGSAQVFRNIKAKRVLAKKEERKTENETLKLALNGSVGMYRNSYGWLYDVQPNLAISLTGQFLILRLTELCIANGINVMMQNTDGITVLMKKELEPIHEKILQQVSEEFRVKFEKEYYKAVYASNINNYLAIKSNGKTKQKGWFVTNPVLENSRDFLVIPKAIEAHLTGVKDYRTFIQEHTDIFDFCASYKIAKKYKVYWWGNEVQNLNRFYPSNTGAYLYKTKKTSKEMENVFKESAVELYNLHKPEEVTLHLEKVNRKYFEQKCFEILYDLGIFGELKLF